METNQNLQKYWNGTNKNRSEHWGENKKKIRMSQLLF